MMARMDSWHLLWMSLKAWSLMIASRAWELRTIVGMIPVVRTTAVVGAITVGRMIPIGWQLRGMIVLHVLPIILMIPLVDVS